MDDGLKKKTVKICHRHTWNKHRFFGGHDCDQKKCVMQYVECVVAISKRRRKITIKIEKSEGVTSVPMGDEYYNISSELRYCFSSSDISEVGIFYN